MNVRGRSLKLLSLGIVLTGLWTMNACASDALPEAKFTEQGTERCLDCHAGANMTVIADTPHGDPENPNSPYAQKGCESCHGKGSLHVSRARGGAGFPALVRFKRGGSSVEDQNGACLNCHAYDMGELEGMAWAGSLHDPGRMTCGNCHEMHVADNSMASATEQKKSCATCHEEQIAAHPRFESKGIMFDQLVCSNCHDPHQLQRKPE